MIVEQNDREIAEKAMDPLKSWQAPAVTRFDARRTEAGENAINFEDGDTVKS